jgi:regulator of replication initiation timing
MNGFTLRYDHIAFIKMQHEDEINKLKKNQNTINELTLENNTIKIENENENNKLTIEKQNDIKALNKQKKKESDAKNCNFNYLSDIEPEGGDFNDLSAIKLVNETIEYDLYETPEEITIKKLEEKYQVENKEIQEKHTNEVKVLHDDMFELNRNNTQLIRENQTLTKNILNLNNKITTLEKTNTELTNSNKTITLSNQSLKDKIIELNQAKQKSEIVIDTFISETTTLKIENQQLKHAAKACKQ